MLKLSEYIAQSHLPDSMVKSNQEIDCMNETLNNKSEKWNVNLNHTLRSIWFETNVKLYAGLVLHRIKITVNYYYKGMTQKLD